MAIRRKEKKKLGISWDKENLWKLRNKQYTNKDENVEKLEKIQEMEKNLEKIDKIK